MAGAGVGFAASGAQHPKPIQIPRRTPYTLTPQPARKKKLSTGYPQKEFPLQRK
jgi:hypothetical protein